MNLLLIISNILAVAEAAKQSFSFSLKATIRHGLHLPAKHGRFDRLTSRKGNLKAMKKFGSIQQVYTKDNKDFFLDVSLGPDEHHLQKFKLLIDTNSPVTWVPRQGCETIADQPNYCRRIGQKAAPDNAKPTYNSKGRFKHENIFFSEYPLLVNTDDGQKYGNVKGALVEDNVWLGSSSNGEQPRKIGWMSFGAADEIELPNDQGIIGLSVPNKRLLAFVDSELNGALSNDSKVNQTSNNGSNTELNSTYETVTNTGSHFLVKLKRYYQMTSFTLFYQRSNNESDTNSGLITFGDHDRNHCKGVSSYADVVEGSKNWEFHVDSIVVNKNTVFRNTKVLSDSGLPNILVPKEDFDTILQAMGAEYNPETDDLPTINCTSIDSSPLEVRIKGMPFRLYPSDIATKVADSEHLCKFHMAGQADSDEKKWIFGAPWTQAFCQVYDYTNPERPMIAFAGVKHRKNKKF